MNAETTIVIADDHPLFREGVRAMIETEESFSIVAETSDGKTALAMIERYRPQIAVLDIDMPGMSGLDVARTVREKELPVEVIILTMYCEEKLFQAAVNIGVKGYILKDSARTDIIDGIKAAVKGKSFISPELSTVIMSRFRQMEKSREESRGLESLSATQRQVLKLIAQEKTSKEIAVALCISQRTVDTHRAKIAAKLDLQGSLALVKYAILHKSEI